MLHPDDLARDLAIKLTGCQYLRPFRYMNENHVPGGSPEGGQFTGKAEHGQSPDQMAEKTAQPATAGGNVSRDDMLKFLMDEGHLTDQQISQMYNKAKSSTKAARPEKAPMAELDESGNKAVSAAKAFLEGINQGHTSEAELDRAVEPMANLPMEQLPAVMQALKLAGSPKSRKAVSNLLRSMLKSQAEMWVKTRAMRG